MTRGFIIAVPSKYENFTYRNILTIRYKYKIDDPIELWEIGNEITEKTRDLLNKINNIYFKNVCDYTDNPSFWKGFQIKAFILKHTELAEPILCDADMSFHTHPYIIFRDMDYIKTGTFFFRDLAHWTFSNLHKTDCKFQSIDFYNNRKAFILSLLPQKSKYFPKEWEYIYSDEIPKTPVHEAYQESGVVYINKNMHSDAVDKIYELNKNHEHVYQYIWGDKETFWLSFLCVNKPYAINKTFPLFENGKLTHYYNGVKFFSQK